MPFRDVSRDAKFCVSIVFIWGVGLSLCDFNCNNCNNCNNGGVGEGLEGKKYDRKWRERTETQPKLNRNLTET